MLFRSTSAGRIERLDPNTNRVLDSISRERVGFDELGGGIAAGAGALWTATYLDKTLWKIDPVTGDFVGGVPLGGAPAGVAFGDGAVWIVRSDGTLLRVDPQSQKVVRKIPLGVYASQSGSGEVGAQGRWAPVAVGYGAVWLAVTP